MALVKKIIAMIGAVIDLGTNTFNLLIYKKQGDDYTIIHSKRQAVSLGEGGMKTNIITPEAFKRGVATLVAFKQQCNQFDVTIIKAFGTSALRGAINTYAFKAEVLQQTGIVINVISGEEEAQLIYEGVKNVHTFNYLSCIMDIGGGSTEFILADEKGMLELKSFNIGVARMIQTFELSDPLSKEDILTLEHYLATTTQPFFETHSCKTLIGASGSFDTFYELLFNTPYTELWSSALLPQKELLEKLDQLIHSSCFDREQDDRILDLRKNMIHIAALKTRWVIQQLHIEEVWVSPASLKEGVMFSKLDSL